MPANYESPIPNPDEPIDKLLGMKNTDQLSIFRRFVSSFLFCPVNFDLKFLSSSLSYNSGLLNWSAMCIEPNLPKNLATLIRPDLDSYIITSWKYFRLRIVFQSL